VRYIFLSIFAIFAYTTAMMMEPETQGYSQADQDGMDRLVNKLLMEKPTQHKRTGKMSGAEQAAALRYLWGDGR